MVPLPATRRAPQRLAPSWEQPEEPQFAPEPQAPVAPLTPAERRQRRKRILKRSLAALLALVLLIAALIGWRVWSLMNAVNEGLGRVDNLTLTPNLDDGETWLIVGSDERGAGSGTVQDSTQGQRSDSIMVLNKAPNGQVTLTSLPRDTYVAIPGNGHNKINASFSFGGPGLLVSTVQDLTGLTVDHYAQVGMGAVEDMVNAVGGVNVCLDYNVHDADSGLVWDTSQGQCQNVDGTKALAYSRMRKSDPMGDIGRGLRQRAVVSAVVNKAADTSTLTDFDLQDRLVEAGTKSLAVDHDTSATTLAKMALNVRKAQNANLTGAPPIASLNYMPGGVGSTVLLRDTTAPDFFSRLRAGTLTANDFNQVDG